MNMSLNMFFDCLRKSNGTVAKRLDQGIRANITGAYLA